MCGIWTRVKFTEPVKSEELLAPIATLRHRGPDGYGWYADDHVAMVHTRLSIIDLSGGAQPLDSFDKRWIGIVNGELYDYEVLRDELIKEGVQFKTRSDSEVLLNLFARRGARALANLSGEFAFIFYDRVEGRICFGRDPFGVKPLFIENRGDQITLSSEMKALSEEAPVFDPIYLQTFLARMMVPPRTCLENVQHVLPGRVYTLDLKSKRLTYEIYRPAPVFQKRDLSKQDAFEMLDFELRGAVKRRLRADVEVGCYLSGGIDSALVAALAADLGARPKAFTVGFADRAFDESNEAAHIARDLGIEHSVVQLTSKTFMDSLIRSIVAFENPISNPHGAAKNLLANHASHSVKVVLSGEGSDELFGGYSYLRVQKLARFLKRHPRLAPNALERYIKGEMELSLGHLEGASDSFAEISTKAFAGQAPALFSRLVKRRWYRTLTGNKLESVVERICAELSSSLREEHPHAHLNSLDLNLWIGLRSDLLHYVIANVGDRQEMSHALEGRTPFLDIRVADVAARTQEKHLLHGLTEKYILRRVGAKYLQKLHHSRHKRPFFAPTKHLYLRDNRSVMNDYIERSRRETPWLNWKIVDHLLLNPKRSLESPLEAGVFTLRAGLFSVGVLAENLRVPQEVDRKGYGVPKSVNEIIPFRKGSST